MAGWYKSLRIVFNGTKRDGQDPVWIIRSSVRLFFSSKLTSRGVIDTSVRCQKLLFLLLAHAFRLTLNFVGRYLDEIDKGPQWRRHKPPSRAIERRPRETLPPGFEGRFESTAFKVWAQPVLEQWHDAGARDRGVDEEIGGAAEPIKRRSRAIGSWRAIARLGRPPNCLN